MEGKAKGQNMLITSIRLKNFKGFREVHLPLRPLTVILGPNSAGKSAFGQALVALHKIHEHKSAEPTLMLERGSSVDIGSYKELVSVGCEGAPVVIGVGLNNDMELKFGFGGGAAFNENTGINELDLTLLEADIDVKSEMSMFSTPGPTNSTTEVSFDGTIDDMLTKKVSTKSLKRRNNDIWEEHFEDYFVNFKLMFAGLRLRGAMHESGTSLNPDDLIPGQAYARVIKAIERVAYLRPDRVPPARINRVSEIEGGLKIGDRGEGTAWFIHEMGKKMKVESYNFPNPTTDKDKAKEAFQNYREREPEAKALIESISEWMQKLGLVSNLWTQLEGGKVHEKGIRLKASLKANSALRSLSDLGFGVSQALPIITNGLTLKKGGLLIVEQPEAQLHPKPQAELADFFCSMVKCGRNALVETHSEALFHRLRLRAALDQELANQIAVYFIDEPHIDESTGQLLCANPRKVSLKAEDELSWPKGFMSEGVRTELEITAAQLAALD